MSNKKKESIIPKLDNNFNESIFFLEIQYKKSPSKEIKEKLINYYIKGVDYYTGTNQKDFSLYFQTKLLNIMKEQDHFEKTVESKLKEENQKEKINEILDKANNTDIIKKNTINEDLQKQKEQFLFNLSLKKRNRRLKRFNSLKISSNTKNKLAFKSRKESVNLSKKNSIDYTSFNNNKLNNINSNKNNNIFSKVDNSLSDFNKINTLLIIEYVKKLKQFTKLKLASVDKKTNKYLEYIQTNNQLNLLYEDLSDADSEEAKNMKNQIKANEEEWELFEKESQNEDIKMGKNMKDIINVKDIPNIDKILDNIFNKMNELIKENNNN